MADVFSPIYLGLPGLALLLFWSPVSRAEESAPPAAGPSPTSIASEAGPSPSPTATPPRTAAENASFAAVFRLGWDAANERRYHDAVTEYSEAIRLKPDDPAVYNNRGAVYQILKQYHCGLQPSDLAETERRSLQQPRQRLSGAEAIRKCRIGLHRSDSLETGFRRSVCQSRLYSENVE